MDPTPEYDHYPVFAANQVLSNIHLNQVFNYLDEQERLTRANLNGIGIVCGLVVKLDTINGTKILLSKGCGVTSQGYLIIEPKDVVSLVSYRDYLLPTDLSYPSFIKNKATNTQYQLWELLSPEALDTGITDAKSLSDADAISLTNKAILLFLELKKQDLRNCSPNNCDDRGADVTATVRRLLVTKDDLLSICDSPLVEFQKLSLDVPEIPMRRINFSTSADLYNYQVVFKNYFSKQISGKTIIVRLTEAIDKAYAAIKILLPELSSFDKAKLASIFAFPAISNEIAIQYYFDLLRDLTSAYHELRVVLLQQLAVCLPDGTLFPRHLALGVPDGSTPSEWRTGYFPSPAVVTPEYKLEELRFLFDRLNQIVLNFNVKSGTTVELKITPSLYGVKQLSGKSLPFYYKAEIRPYWDASRRGEKSREVLSWHVDASSPDHVRDPLQYDLEPYNFFRVEGIIGKNISSLTDELGKLLKDKRLPFSILHVNVDKMGNFLDKHFAIYHEAGALLGGTLVVMHCETGPNANLVVSDFSLPYRIEKEETSRLGRVFVNECDYEWFDSKKHLSSLAQREYRFPPRPAFDKTSKQKAAQERDKAKIAKDYVILIYRYEIQGHSLIGSGPVEIKIPIAQLVKGQLSEIARKLNEAFPAGLIFDHIPNSNKLLIRYFSDHTFRIEWGGLQGNQIRYAYTNEGIYRWHKARWEPLDHLPNFKVVCRLRNEYRADEYMWLQEDDYFDADYPMPTPMPTSNELIVWEKMIQKRAKKVIADLPIKTILERIQHVINGNYNVGGDVGVTLVGSWANGSWVCRDSSKNKFPAGFLALRQKVTGKTGASASDIDLLFEIKSKSINVDAILTTLNEDELIKNSGYIINILLGKENAQKGMKLS